MKLLKWLVLRVLLLLLLPMASAELLARRIAGRDVWLGAQTEFLSLFPGKTGVLIRNAYYHLVLAKCPLDCCLSFGTIVSKNGAELGHRVYMGWQCFVGLTTIGDDTMLADNVHVLSGRHQHGTGVSSVPFQGQPQVFSRVEIGRNCWIGSNAVIMADVGANSIIGAGSVVTKPIPENSVAVGNPARVIRSTNSSEEVDGVTESSGSSES